MNTKELHKERGKADPYVIYEDTDVVVVHKSAGTMVHTDGKYNGTTIVGWLLTHAPKARGIGEAQTLSDGTPLERSGIVHRLDRETSGVLILAKTQKAFEHLKGQFHDRHTKKEYRAFVYGTMKEKWGTIERPIGRSAKDFRLRSAERGAKGTLRDAVTGWELIGQSDSYAYLKVFPLTGRTHQIRVHLKAIGRPVIGDQLYASKDRLAQDGLGFHRLALHAYRLTLVLPSGEEKTFTAELPLPFIQAADSIAT